MLCDTKEEARNVLFDFMKNQSSSIQTRRILFEKLKGREISAFALFDGQQWMPIGYVGDYKRVYDDDKGPNTGGRDHLFQMMYRMHINNKRSLISLNVSMWE